jgi:hypothetical protein
MLLRRGRVAARGRECEHDESRGPPGSHALLEQVEEQDRVQREQDRDEDRQARQVPLDDVRAALLCRSEAHPTETGVTAGMHQDQPDQARGEQYLDDREELEHAARIPAVFRLTRLVL